MPDIFVGSDHRGFELKGKLVAALSGGVSPEDQIPVEPKDGEEYQVIDLGPFSYDPEDDYNDYAVAVAKAVIENENARGIIVCGSAHGVAIQANRIKGVRAIAAYNPELAEIGRKHNNANILCLSADFGKDPEHTVEAFMNTDFIAEDRYVRRNEKLDQEVI